MPSLYHFSNAPNFNVATALDAGDRHRFLTNDPGNGRDAVVAKAVASKALCEAAYHNQLRRFGRLTHALDPREHGAAAPAQAVMANHPRAVARLLAWGTPVTQDSVAWNQVLSVNTPRVIALLEKAQADLAPIAPPRTVDRHRSP